MNILTHFSKRISLFPLLALVCTASFLLSSSSFAKSYTTTVTIHEYYGFQGRDSDGRHLYGVRVKHGNDYYYVELMTPMPCLTEHRNEKARVTLNRANNRWTDVAFDGHYARIHRVTKMRMPSYLSYRNHDHSNHR